MTLKEAYAPLFKIGSSVSRANLDNPLRTQLLKDQFNSMTCENDMKPMYFMDTEETLAHPEKYDRCPAVTFDIARKYLDFAKENNIALRGHTLAWHGQTPRWFFHENYNENGPFASRALILERLENYIHAVLDFVQTEYPGVVYAWDVFNEIIDEGNFRISHWSHLVGEDFFIKAFEFARKYAAPGVKLFYNDYECYAPWKLNYICEHVLKPLLERGLVDGMGMQSHLLMDHPTLEEYENAIRTYGALGLTLHVTELDIHIHDDSEEGQKALAERYRDIFTLLAKAKKDGIANVECVTLWGLADEDSWLSFFRREKSHPLLFHNDTEAKPAYYAVLNVPSEI